MLNAKLYERPSGGVFDINITEVDAHDAEFFYRNKVKISLEEIGPDDYVAYADIGATNVDGEPDEVMVLSRGRSCRETLAELRQRCELILYKEKPTGILKSGGITINGAMIKALQKMDINNDDLITIQYVDDAPNGPGIYMHFDEYPDEGYAYLGSIYDE